jgi:hypothetical protein
VIVMQPGMPGMVRVWPTAIGPLAIAATVSVPVLPAVRLAPEATVCDGFTV